MTNPSRVIEDRARELLSDLRQLHPQADRLRDLTLNQCALALNGEQLRCLELRLEMAGDGVISGVIVGVTVGGSLFRHEFRGRDETPTSRTVIRGRVRQVSITQSEMSAISCRLDPNAITIELDDDSAVLMPELQVLDGPRYINELFELIGVG